MMKCYRIANWCIINLEKVPINEEYWKLFIIDKQKFEEKKITTWICGAENQNFYSSLEVYHLNEIEHLLKFNDTIMFSDRLWKKNYLVPGQSKDAVELMISKVFYSHVIWKRMIQLHCSTIDFRGKGILFLGPSGIGKTTQAELWNQYRGAKIINGDIGFAQETKEGFLAWGTPWHGSSPYCENTSVLLHAMVVLKQAPENKIRRLDGFEKVKEVADSIFYPTWLENGMELCLEVLNHLLERVPVYELSCRPDEEAVRITENTIF